TGDKGEISLRGMVENVTWQRLSAEDEGCTMRLCEAVMNGTCPFYKARKTAEAAHLLVINHALLLSDATADNRVLPDYHYLVLDEAHNLEDAVTNSLSFRLDEAALRRRLADLGGPRRGLLGDILASVQDVIPEKEVKRLERYIVSINEASALMERHIGSLFSAFRQFLIDVESPQGGEYILQLRVTRPLRERETFAQIQQVWGVVKDFMDAISDAMQQLTDKLTRLENHNIPEFDDLVNSTGTAARYLKDVNAQLTAFITQPDENSVYWISAGQDVGATLWIHAAPLHIGPMAQRFLWEAKDSIVLTSATLRTNNSFEYIRSRLAAEEVETVEVGSPFDYQASTLLYIPTDIPEPNDRQRYQQAVERGIVELAAALNGRVLGLFTSYTHLRQTAQAITPRLALGNITVYDQSDGSSRQALLDGFRSTEKAVLLGTRSFWEGVDIPGESLSALVIVRLPFAVPTDPIFAARSETYSNSFDEYSVPDAILRFRQGFG
ncbi:MAG: DNA polymerase III subunit epsilon, partial [Anaerolineae bacterium]|nr:DNA polymerase III subunit epsilon [Anaerolineae bacterium]